MVNTIGTLSRGRQIVVGTAALVAAALAWLVVRWVDRALAPGLGLPALTVIVALGGVAWHLRARRATALSCATGPRLRPLQVSSLALMALGVQLLHAAEAPAAVAALPLLAAPWLGPAFILAGVGGLGWLSLSATCRDEALGGGAESSRK